MQLEPQSTALFILLLVVFGALLVWVALTKQPAFRVLAASLAFIPAMLFGVVAVNKYYDYYQSWGAFRADLGGQGLTTVPVIPKDVPTQRVSQILGKVTGGKTAASLGETVRMNVTGPGSHITRTVYVFLPPQYFQRSYSQWRFPALELLNGYPGEPQDWINVIGVVDAYETLLHDGVVRPVALIMPDPNGGRQISLQCLNVVHGPQDATYLATELPTYLSHTLRLMPPGPAWGIAGYSEGGYCAANLGLLYPANYGFSGVLSGYFWPARDRLGNPPQFVAPFGKSAALQKENTPLVRVSTLPLFVKIPRFWLAVGTSNHLDVEQARKFQQLLLPRQPNVVLDLAQGGNHTMTTWRALVPPLLEWMTPRMVFVAQHLEARVTGGPAPQAPAPSTGGSHSAIPRPHPSH